MTEGAIPLAEARRQQQEADRGSGSDDTTEPQPPMPSPDDYGAVAPDTPAHVDGPATNGQAEPRNTGYERLCLTLDEWAERNAPPPDFLLGSIFSTTTRAMLPPQAEQNQKDTRAA